MKARTVALLAALAGFAVGIVLRSVPGPGPELEPAPEAAKSSLAPRKSASGKPEPGLTMLGLAEKAATLGRGEWPGFFRAQLGFPDRARLAARLWAESDPAGFWRWLRGERDEALIDRFASDLLRVWAGADPDAAMDAVLQITDKDLGDELRREVVDTVIERDLAKGLELAGRAGDFNSFSWGPRAWMKKDPAAAVKGLAGLPPVSDYRHFLKYALPIWAESDPTAVLEWMKSARPLKYEDWLKDGFEAAAKSGPQAALAAARSLADAGHRATALGGIVSSGTLDAGELADVFGELPLSIRARSGPEMIQAQPYKTAADLAASAALLEQLPPGRDTLRAVDTLASRWSTLDARAGWQWAATLPDAAMRREAYVRLSSEATQDSLPPIADLPLSDLSDELFRKVLQRLPGERRDAWIRQLPADHAAWAGAVRDQIGP